MKYICFFTEGHNGDIVHSKSFVQDIADQLDIPCLYHHKKNLKLTEDLNVVTTQIAPSSYYEKFIETENIFFINTWLYPYLLEKNFQLDVNVETNYNIFSGVCERINKVFNTNIKLKSIENYLPFIDFSFSKTQNIDTYISQNQNKKILFCNGPCLSGQSPYNEDMSSIMEKLSSTYPDITFIATQRFDTEKSNIHFTDDIININECDLNEIGYLSTFCSLIIGRNSGPFCFCTIKQNYNDKNKIFYAFGHRKSDCFHGSLNIKSQFIFDYSSTEQDIYHSLNKIIVENLI